MVAVELRSDTFTLPDDAMRRAMAEAEVGDDVWGEDPTVRRLEEAVASRLRKEAAVYVPSGTMGNLIGVASQTRPGDEVIADREAHVVIYEVAGTAVVAGIQLRLLDGEEGTPSPEQVRAAIRTRDIHFPESRLLCVENTHNRRGGAAIAASRIAAAAAEAHAAGLRVHCDGARLFNAAVALGCDPAELVTECDTVTICLSKGLGAPVGSVISGEAAVVTEARRWRKRLGGGMRQAGILAAAGLHALEHNVERLADDHRRARLLGERLAELPGVALVLPAVPTNMALLRIRGDAAEAARRAAADGVLISTMGPDLLRCVTHLGVDDAGIDRAATVLASVLSELSPAA